MEYCFKTKGVCSREINIELEDLTIKNINFEGGCSGNLKGICSLVAGRNINEVIQSLEGITCDEKPTSCPDQLAIALKEIRNTHK